VQVLSGAGAFTAPRSADGSHWIEHLSVADLSVGTYSVPRGGTDDQDPHTEDEIYVVTAGRARLTAQGQSVAVAAGSVMYVPAGEPHQFTDVTDDLAVLVLFAPAEYSRRASPG